jgi:cell division protein FtsI (penicillin-binding protein 3)
MIGHYGGDLAGPVFRRVAEQSLRYLGVPPSAALVKADQALLRDQAEKAPKPADVPSAAPRDMTVTALGRDQARIPDAAGLGARDALKVMTAAGFLSEIEGSGRVVRQSPEPGAAALRGSVVRLVFESSS